MLDAASLEAPDEPTAHQTLKGLSASIASILEDSHLLAVRGSDELQGDAILLEAGEDIVVLASAMQVIRRRCPSLESSG